MARLVVLAVLATLIAAPALAQVINGETPLDETPLNQPTPGPAVPPPPAARASEDAAPTPRRDLPQSAPRRD